MKYNIVRESGKPTSATVFHRARFYIAAPDHPNFDAIIDALEQGHPPREVIDLFDRSSMVARGFRAAKKLIAKVAGDAKEGYVSEVELRKTLRKIEVKNKKLFFDGEQMHGVLADTIIRYANEGNDNYLPLVRFMAKVMENPNPHSREHLYAWMKNKSFVIYEDGDIIAYKGVYRWHDKANRKIGFKSVYGGTAAVNGKVKTGSIPQRVGDVVTMPRNKVTFDPNDACSIGLHVGTWEFASGYGNTMIEVKIHPKDVVSVPTGDSWQKMRVCRYKVEREVTKADVKLLRSASASA